MKTFNKAETGPATIDSADVIRLILQFLRENGLDDSVKVLSEESGITMNVLDNVQPLLDDILMGRWDQVLRLIGTLQISSPSLYGLYELIFEDLLAQGEVDAARAILRQSVVLCHLKDKNVSRYLKLEGLLSQVLLHNESINELHVTRGRRIEIADQLRSLVPVAPQSRLLALLGEVVRTKTPDVNGRYNLLFGPTPTGAVKGESTDIPISECFLTKTFSIGAHIEAAAFSPKANELAVGFADGALEIINGLTGNLEWTKDGKKIKKISSGPITCLSYNIDGSILAFGTLSGDFSVLKVDTMANIVNVHEAHKEGITVVRINHDNQTILSAGYDGCIRIWKGQNMIRELRKHTSFVNDCHFLLDDKKTMVSCGADGLLCYWDLSLGSLLDSWTPFSHDNLTHEPIRQIIPLSGKIVMLCTKSGRIMRFDLANGQILQSAKSLSSSTGLDNSNASSSTREFKLSESFGDVINASVSPSMKFLYAGHENGCITRTELATKETIALQSAGAEMIGVVAHPRFSQLATFNVEGQLMFWKPTS